MTTPAIPPSDVADRVAAYNATRVPSGRRRSGLAGVAAYEAVARLRAACWSPPRILRDKVRFAAPSRAERRSGHDRRMVTV